MKLKIILSVIMAILTAATIGEGYGWHESAQRNKQYLKLINEQTAIIDSLTNRPFSKMDFEISLQVTDKSTYKINAKGNQGTISAPTGKDYVLFVEMDSVSFSAKNNEK